MMHQTMIKPSQRLHGVLPRCLQCWSLNQSFHVGPSRDVVIRGVVDHARDVVIRGVVGPSGGVVIRGVVGPSRDVVIRGVIGPARDMVIRRVVGPSRDVIRQVVGSARDVVIRGLVGRARDVVIRRVPGPSRDVVIRRVVVDAMQESGEFSWNFHLCTVTGGLCIYLLQGSVQLQCSFNLLGQKVHGSSW